MNQLQFNNTQHIKTDQYWVSDNGMYMKIIMRNQQE